MSDLIPEDLFTKVLPCERVTLVLLELDDDEAIAFGVKLLGEKEWTIDSFRRLGYSVILKPSETHGRLSRQPALYMVHLGDQKGPRIGMISLCRRVPDIPADFGYSFVEGYRGAGYGTEAASRALRYWRYDFGIKEICVVTSYDNVASCALARKIGFVEGGWVAYEGLKEAAFVLPGMEKLDGQKMTFWGDGKPPGQENEEAGERPIQQMTGEKA
jgi:GNAT acetyltransferase-like protein